MRSSRHFVHANLALSLSLAELLFLVGIQRTEHQVNINFPRFKNGKINNTQKIFKSTTMKKMIILVVMCLMSVVTMMTLKITIKTMIMEVTMQ